jgi:transposase
MIGNIVQQGVPLPELRRKPGRRQGEEEVFRGTALVDEVEIELPQEEGKEQEPPIRETIGVRYLVDQSTQLQRQHARALAKSIAKAQEDLSKSLEKLDKRPFSCKEDALREAAKWTRTHRPEYHQATFETQSISKKVKRERKGRPGKEEQPSWVEEWVLEGRMELNAAALQEQEKALGYFVLATWTRQQCLTPTFFSGTKNRTW